MNTWFIPLPISRAEKEPAGASVLGDVEGVYLWVLHDSDNKMPLAVVRSRLHAKGPIAGEFSELRLVAIDSSVFYQRHTDEVWQEFRGLCDVMDIIALSRTRVAVFTECEIIVFDDSMRKIKSYDTDLIESWRVQGTHIYYREFDGHEHDLDVSDVLG